jgi:ADP-ribose pyrophosphatase YjhB (NUDIX family)
MKSEKAHYVVATGVVVKEGKFLITRRAGHEKAYPNLWTVPGGKLESKDYIGKPKDSKDAWYNIGEKLVQGKLWKKLELKLKI